MQGGAADRSLGTAGADVASQRLCRSVCQSASPCWLLSSWQRRLERPAATAACLKAGGGCSAPRRPAALPVARLRADLLEDRLEEDERRQHVLAGERARAGGAACGERLLDRAMLLRVLQVEPVDRVVARRPDGGA